jgi:hypothetical protein
LSAQLQRASEALVLTDTHANRANSQSRLPTNVVDVKDGWDLLFLARIESRFKHDLQ